MLSISNEELENLPPLKDMAECPGCKEMHPIEYGDKVLPDGTSEESKDIAFIKCPTSGKSYLVGICGKMLKPKGAFL